MLFKYNLWQKQSATDFADFTELYKQLAPGSLIHNLCYLSEGTPQERQKPARISH